MRAIIIFSPLLLITITAKAEICIEASRTCISPAETRIINGESIYKDCWSYNVTYNCYDETNQNYNDNCSAIRSNNNCSQATSECQTNLESGNCLSYKNSFLCSAPIDNYQTLNLTLEEKSQKIASEYLDTSSCNNFSNTDCNLSSSRICIDNSLNFDSTQTINGLQITRDCWNYQEGYSCLTNKNSCSELDSDSNCSYLSEECLSSNSQGECTYLTKSYNCPLTITNEQTNSCQSQTYCIGENCDTVTYNKDQNFAKAVASLSALENAALELNPDDLSTFSGTTNRCSKDLVNYSDCCALSGWADNISSSNQCSTEDQELVVKRQNRLCVYVGAYCSEEIELGFGETCTKKKESYCCFSSKLVRIIHEQARPQLGISWGSTESPNCAGISIENLQKIDFSKIDFSELISEINANASANIPDNSQISAQVEQVINNYYQGGAND